MSALLRVENLHVSYGARKVLSGVSFSVEGGTLCALLGLNGSGKSTLLKAVCGLLKYKADVLSAEGVSLQGMDERRRARRIAYLPQRVGPVSGFTVEDILLMGYNPQLGLLDRPSRVQRASANLTLAQVGLAGQEERLFDELSEGQRQLVVFARALVQNAPVMLFDEPDSALDYVNRHQLLGRVGELVRGRGKAGLITLHDPNFAMAYCDRLLLLKDGALVGDVDMGRATAEDLSRELGKLYGAVRVAEEDGQRFMLQRRE